MKDTMTPRQTAMIEDGLKLLTDDQLELALEASLYCLDTWRRAHDPTLQDSMFRNGYPR